MRRLASGVLLAIAGAACAAEPRSAAYRPLRVGDAVPEYVVHTLAGDSVRVGANELLTLVNVWATWCASCREEFADLEQLSRDFGGRGLRVLAVSVDRGSARKVSAFVESQGTTFAVAHDPGSRIQQAFQVVGVPESYLVSRSGRLLWRRAGGLHGAPQAVREAVARATAR